MSATTKRVPLPGAKSKRTNKRAKKATTQRGQYKKFGLPVREAERDLVMPLLQVDIEAAEKIRPDDVNAEENFLSCVIAQAATRAWGAERVAIMRETAYVGFPGEKHTKRYVVDSHSRQVLEAWDRGEHIVEGVELRLKVPTGGKTRIAQAKRNQEWREKHGSSAKFPGGRKTKRKQRQPEPHHNIIRNGNLVRWN